MENTQSFLTISEGKQGRYEEKKSVFLGEARHVETEEDALAFVEKSRKKYYDARHHCFAWRIGLENPKLRASDDGEPSGTAGKPILDVLTGAALTDVVLVVTRYFGGTLLGTGGLVRAYTAAARDCLEKSTVVRKIYGAHMRIGTDYTDLGKIQYLLAQEKITILASNYTDAVELEIIFPAGDEKHLEKKLTELTAGRVRPELIDHIWYEDANTI